MCNFKGGGEKYAAVRSVHLRPPCQRSIPGLSGSTDAGRYYRYGGRTYTQFTQAQRYQINMLYTLRCGLLKAGYKHTDIADFIQVHVPEEYESAN